MIESFAEDCAKATENKVGIELAMIRMEQTRPTYIKMSVTTDN